MPKISRQVGSTSQIVELVAVNTGSSPPGLPLGGLVYNSPGLTCYYKRNTASADVVVTPVTISALGTYTSGGFAAVDATNMPGLYEFHIPNAALASGADTVTFCLNGATNLAPQYLEIELTATSNQDAVHGGMSALPNASASASGGLLTYGTSTGQINVDGAGNASANVAKILGTASAGAAGYVGIDWAHVNAPSAAVGLSGTTVGTLTNYTGNTPQTGDSYARIGATGSGLTSLAPASTALSTAQWTNPRAGNLDNLDAAVSTRSTYAGGAVASVTGGVGGNVAGSVGSVVGNVGGNLLGTVSTLTTYTGNTPQTGDSFARIGSTGSGLTSLAPASTALSTVQWTNTRAGNLDNLDAAVSTRSTYAGGAVASVTGSVGSIAGVTFPTHFSSLAIDTSGRIDVGHVLGVASAGQAGYVGLDWGQVANLSSTNNLSNTTISTGQAIQTVTGNVAGNVGGVSSAVTVGSNQDKTGYSLASTGLNSISVVAPTGVATTFPGMLVQVWRRFFKASAKSASTLTIETFADDGVTVVTTQGYTDDGAGTETLSGSS